MCIDLVQYLHSSKPLQHHLIIQLTGQTFVPFPLDSQISVPSPSKKLKSFEKSGLKSLEQCDAGVLFRGMCHLGANISYKRDGGTSSRYNLFLFPIGVEVRKISCHPY